MKKTIFIIGLILLAVLEISKAQSTAGSAMAIWLTKNSLWIRVVLLSLVLNSFYFLFKKAKRPEKWIFSLALVAYIAIFFYCNYYL